MSFPKYPAYKDSGVEWIGKIPAGWGVAPLFSISTENRDKNTGLKSSNTLSLSYGNIIERDKNNNFGLLPDSYETYQIVKFGDIIFRLTDLQNDKNSLRSAISRYDGIITSAYLSIKTANNCCPFYVSYLMRAYDCEKVFYSMGGGVRQSLNFKEFKYLPVILPPLPEQQAIASFLDRECGKIDVLIAEQERLIALLAEKRQAVISDAVTKGLNPNAPMKDSGIPWIGMVPEEWEVVRLKIDMDFLTSGSRGWAEYYSDNGAVFLRIGNLTRNGMEIDLSDIQRVTVPENTEGERTRVQSGDILFSITAYLGSVAVVPIGFQEAYVSQHVALVRLKKKIFLPEWVAFATLSGVGKNYLSSKGYGGTKIQLSLDDIANIVIPTPSCAEQKAIILYLNSKIQYFDHIVKTALNAVTLLKERRVALISAAVTGKIDVRAQSKAIAA